MNDGPSNFLTRSMAFLTESGTEKLRKSTVGVAGCGGVGGTYAVMMAKLGVGNFLLADPGEFDLPDVNRQWAASTETIGQKKIDVYERVLKTINPQLSIMKYKEGISDENVRDFVQQSDLIADCLDVEVDIGLRGKLYKHAREKKIYSITFPILGFGGICVVSSPGGMSMDIFLELLSQVMTSGFPGKMKDTFVPEHVRLVENSIRSGIIPSLGIATNITPGLACTESLLILINECLPAARKPVVLPDIIMIDLFNMKYSIINIKEIMG